MLLPIELIFHWMWLIYKDFAPGGAANQIALSNIEMRRFARRREIISCSRPRAAS
jgi:hypothetical protein